MAVVVDERLTNADSLPEVQENFNRVLKIIDEGSEGSEERIDALEEALEGKMDIGGDVIIASSTEGSSKKFRLTVDDDGELTAVEIEEPEADPEPEPDPQEGE